MNRRRLLAGGLPLAAAATLATAGSARASGRVGAADRPGAGAGSVNRAVLKLVRGDHQTEDPNRVFSDLKVQLVGEFGPVPDVPVTFTVLPGTGSTFPGGAVETRVRTDDRGYCTAAPLTARSPGGKFQVRVTAPNALDAHFDLEVGGGSAGELLLAVDGSGQQAPPGTPFQGLRARALERDGTPLPGRTVVFAVPATDTTGTRFPGNALEAIAETDATGHCVSPAPLAGATEGTLTVDALLRGSTARTAFHLTVSTGAGGGAQLVPQPPTDQTVQPGEVYADPLAVRVQRPDGTGVARHPVRFTLLGDTRARFTDGTVEHLAVSGGDGIVRSLPVRASSDYGTTTLAVAFSVGGAVGHGEFTLTTSSTRK
ncbi:hypothetical protein [Streptomyces sp. NPDC050504]|uniref:hypothetical protein n=1 Tax=Streptomyces sp. NPDC050504 TaxID=3365618 RepID=UPI0037AF68BC